jgi:leucyl aminopeptidase
VAITFALTTQSPDRVRADLLAAPMFADAAPGPGADIVDRALGGTLRDYVEEAGFKGKPDETLVVPIPGRSAAKVAVLVGLGDPGDVSTERLRRAAAAVARRAARASSVVTTLLAAAPDLDGSRAAEAVAEGFVLGSYRFLEYKSDGEPQKLSRVTVAGGTGPHTRTGLDRGAAVAAAVSWARDMVNEPAGAKSPAEFAAAARRLLSGRGVSVTVLTEPQLRAQKMGGVLGVGQGSARPPRFVRAVYQPTGARAAGTLALVGKGVVFDSGGLSLKTSSGMESMKIDMSGAAAVLATMSALRALGVRRRVVAYAPMVENMPSGTAIRPGDVLRMLSGTTVEVLNTDAEGRLILADALALAVSEGADAIVDVATLTGACMVALGEKVAGVMGNERPWVDQVQAAADRAGEPMWPLPLPREYRKLLDSEVADQRNVSTGSYGGALTAGLFLERFVGDVTWAHLDIAGPASASSDDGEVTKGGTGYGVRTLLELAGDPDLTTGVAGKPKARRPAAKTTKRSKKASRRTPAKRR